MRRSSKASHLISQSGQDETYKFRCMEYLNFVLDQVVNQQNRFKLYSSHIEHLLRNNLNDITIQDIEKIKRMLDEGQKQKLQTQQTGQFINYDLIDKLKYSHPNTHYYLQQVPQQSLQQYYGTNEYTLEQVQQIKNRNREQRLYQGNYKMLDLMFKLPQDYQKLQDEIEKQIQRQIDDRQLQQGMEIQKGNTNNFQQQQLVVDKLFVNNSQINDIVNNDTQKQNFSQQNISIQNNLQLHTQIQQLSDQNILLTQNQKPLIPHSLLPPQQINFVQIKKKKSTKKKNILNNQEKPLIQDKNIEGHMKLQLQLNQNKIQQNQNPQQYDQQDNNLAIPPQKRKYIRKKPIEPKKPKAQKSKNVQNEIEANEEQKQEKGQVNVQGEIKQSNIKQILTLKKQVSQKQKKPKKPKKSAANNQNNAKQTKKSANLQQIQIMLPFPQCEQQVKQLKREIQELNKRLEDEKLMFEKNMHHAQTIRNKVQNGEQNNKNMEVVNNGEGVNRAEQLVNVGEKMINSENYEKMINSENQEKKIQQQEMQLNNQNKQIIINNDNHYHQTFPQTLTLQQQPIPTIRITQQKKKQKSTTKLNVMKKESSKKSSSQSYKPPQDELQSISQIEKSGKSLLIDDDESETNKKEKKQKRKYTKKKSNKQLSVTQKRQQTINNYSQSINPSLQNQSQTVNNNSKQKKLKLTNQQRQRIKLQKQKLKQMKIKQKQEKKKLKQLQKMQKQAMKLTSKLGQKSHNKSIGKINYHSIFGDVCNNQVKEKLNVNVNVVANTNIIEDNKQKNSLIDKSNDNLQLVIENNQLPLPNSNGKQLTYGEKQKQSLQQSIGNNSTKQDIKLNNSYSVDNKQQNKNQMKLLQQNNYDISHNLSNIIQHVQQNKAQRCQQHKQQQPVIQQQMQQQTMKRKYPLINNEIDNQQQIDEFNTLPKKRVKLICKQSAQYIDPQYGIQHLDNNNQPKYLIQVFGHVQQVVQNSPQILQFKQNNKVINQINQKQQQQIQFQDQKRQLLEDNQYHQQIQQQHNSSSLSAEN